MSVRVNGGSARRLDLDIDEVFDRSLLGADIGIEGLASIAGCSVQDMRWRLSRVSPETAVAMGPSGIKPTEIYCTICLCTEKLRPNERLRKMCNRCRYPRCFDCDAPLKRGVATGGRHRTHRCRSCEKKYRAPPTAACASCGIALGKGAMRPAAIRARRGKLPRCRRCSSEEAIEKARSTLTPAKKRVIALEMWERRRARGEGAKEFYCFDCGKKISTSAVRLAKKEGRTKVRCVSCSNAEKAKVERADPKAFQRRMQIVREASRRRWGTSTPLRHGAIIGEGR